MSEDRQASAFMEQIAEVAPLAFEGRAPSRLKARIFTAIVRRQQESGPLQSLADTGFGLCVFEGAVAMLPAADGLKRRNPCEVCHARLLAERLERAPIYWKNCPYAEFQNR